MEQEQARKVIHALLYMTDHALTDREIADTVDEKQFTPELARETVLALAAELDAAGSPLQVTEVAGGFQMATRPEFAPHVRRLYKERLTVRLSPSSLETLSIIAYKQPITRSEVEQIRGVEASGVMETLLERRLVKVVGRKETIGRPLLYGTTIEFLRHFGLRHLSELPDPNSLPATGTAVMEEPATDDMLPGLTHGSAGDESGAELASEAAIDAAEASENAASEMPNAEEATAEATEGVLVEVVAGAEAGQESVSTAGTIGAGESAGETPSDDADEEAPDA